MTTSLRTILLASVSAATLTLNGTAPLAASCTAIGGSITTACTGPYVPANLSNLTITNSGSITSTGIGVNTTGKTIGTLENDGTISTSGYAISDNTGGSIGTLENTGVITSTAAAILTGSNATIGNLVNDGSIHGNTRAVFSYGSFKTITNNGVITSSGTAIWEIATIGTIVNNGTISTPGFAIGSSGTIGTIINSGLIVGQINISQTSTLVTIDGGGNGTVGTFTGSAGYSSISAAAGIIFGSGSLLMNDDINVGTNTVTNAGTDLRLARATTITGNYVQGSSGDLMIEVGTSTIGKLTISGTASLTGSHISISTIAGGSLTSGEVFTVVSATGGLAATGISASTDGLYTDSVSTSTNTLLVTLTDVGPVGATVTHMETLTSGTGSVTGAGRISAATAVLVNGSGVSLVNNGTISGSAHGITIGASAGADTITNTGLVTSGGGTAISNAGTIGALTNSGTISGGAYAIYSSGGIDTITDNGLIAGNIYAAGTLTFNGGTSGTLASYSGTGLGTITASGVTIHSANVLLADQITVGGGTGTVANTGATVEVTQAVSISGNYTQASGGTLVIGVSSSGSGELVISGGADLSNSTVSITTLSGATLYYGESLTIVSAGSVADSGLTVAVPSGYNETISLVGGNLVVTLLNPDPWPITTAVSQTPTLTSGIGSISNTGTISGVATGVVVSGAATTLTNNGTIDASGVGVTVTSAASAVSIVNGGTIAGGTVGIANAGTIATLTNSGTIAGSAYAISNSGSIGTITDSGVIAGDISSSLQALAIDGGTAGTVGTLTGYGGGTGTITTPGLTFSSGNLLLDDMIAVGTGTVANLGANLQVNRRISITGNYVQGSTGSLILGVSSPTNYGQLAISGAATLTNSAITIAAINGAALSAGETFTVVSAGTLAATGITATSSGFTDTVTITGDAIVVSLASPSTWTQRADSAGRAAIPVGPVLDNLSGGTAYQTILSQLAALSGSEQTHALRQLNASQLAPQINAALDVTAPTTFAIEQHEMLLGQNQTGSGGGQAAGSDTRQGAFWGQILGEHASRDSSNRTDGYTVSGFGLLFGTDIPVSNDVTGGLAVSWLRSYSRGRADTWGSNVKLDSYQLTGYGSWRPDGGAAFLRGQLAAGYNRYDQKRAIDFLGSTATAGFDGRHYQAKIGAGYDLPAGNGLTLTPLASVQMVRMENDAYQENGAGPANLSVHRQGFNTAESEFGARLSGETAVDWGRMGGDISAAWVHAYTNSPISTSVAMGGVGFVATTARPAADGLRVTTGVELHKIDDVSIRLEYDGDFRSDYQSHTGLVKVRIPF